MVVRTLSRTFLATLIVAVCFACIGCGGGGGGGGSGVSQAYLKVPELEAEIPKAPPTSVRGDVKAEPAKEDFSVDLVNPETGETLFTVIAKSIDSSSAAKYVIKFGTDISVVAPSKGVLRMVVKRLSVAIMRGYFSSAVPEAGQTKTMEKVTVDSTALAKALAFEEWQAKYAVGTFDNFVNQVANETTFADKLVTLVTTINITLKEFITTAPYETFTWEAVDAVKTLADDFKDVAAPPKTGGVGIPANIQIAGFVASPATQVRCAIESILNLANIGMPSRITGSVAPSTSAVPAVPALTPILGSNQAIDIKGLRNLLMASLSGGTSATEGPIADLSSPASSISYTSNSVEIIDKGFDYLPGTGNVVRNVKKQLIEGVEVTAANGIISEIKFGANTKFTNEKYDFTTGNVVNRTIFTIKSGISGSMLYHQKEASVGFIELYSWQSFQGKVISGIDYTHKGYLKVVAEISGAVAVDVILNDIAHNIQAGGTLTMNGAVGSITETRPFYYGKYGSKINNVFYPAVDQSDYFYQDVETELADTLEFSGQALTIGVTAESTARDVYLKQLSLNLSGISKISSGEHEGEYTVGGITGTVLAAYNGTSYKDYGYIKQLEITISNAAFDPSATPTITNGSTVTLKKTNSDNTVDTLTYTMSNGKPVLSGTTNFQGGDATVTTTDGKIKYTGTITFQDPKAKKMDMEYEAMCVNSPETSLVATATLTVDGATKRIITYTYAPSAPYQEAWSRIQNGLYMDGNKQVLGNFRWYEYGPWQQNLNNTVYSADIPGWQNFKLEN